MKVFLFFVLIGPNCAWAQMQPHRAEYILRLGVAANAPRIGTVMQDITRDCKKWHIKRNVLSEIAFTPSLKVSFGSKLDGEESLDGKEFRYQSIDAQNGIERDTQGKVGHADGEIRVELLSPNGPEHSILPPSTLMPIAAMSFLTSQLRVGAALAPTPVFGAEVTGGAFLIEVKELDIDSIRPLPPTIKSLNVPTEKFWSIAMIGTRALDNAHKSLFSLRARLFDSGVMDRLTIDTGGFIVTADLAALEMHKGMVCPE